MEQFKNNSDEQKSKEVENMFKRTDNTLVDFDKECLENAKDYLEKKNRNESFFEEKEKLDLLISHIYTDLELNYIFGRKTEYPYDSLSRLKEDSLFYVTKAFEDKYDKSLFDSINEAKFSIASDIDVLILDRISSLLSSKNYSLYDSIYKERFKK